MNGRVLAEKLAAERPEMSVLFMSGYTDLAMGHQGILDEGACLLQKPFTQEALLAKLREVADAPRATPSPSTAR
jgi:FixJ family two-component response regulator